MPLFEKTFSLEIPIKIGKLDTVFFINNNLFVNNWECKSFPHCHHDFEIRYVNSGVCNQVINKQNYLVEAGNLLLIHPQEYHHQNSNNASSQYNLRFSVTPPPPSATTKQKAYEACLSILKDIRRMEDTSGTLRLYLEGITREIYQKGEGYNEIIRSLCVLAFIELLRMSGNPLKLFFPPEDFRYRSFNRTRVDDFFREKYLTNIKIKDLADDMKVSERQVNRFMNKMFGVSFTKKLTDMRLEKAASLLAETDAPIPEIVQTCGFNSDKYFYQCFKNKFGISPKKYRAENATVEVLARMKEQLEAEQKQKKKKTPESV